MQWSEWNDWLRKERRVTRSMTAMPSFEWERFWCTVKTVLCFVRGKNRLNGKGIGAQDSHLTDSCKRNGSVKWETMLSITILSAFSPVLRFSLARSVLVLVSHSHSLSLISLNCVLSSWIERLEQVWIWLKRQRFCAGWVNGGLQYLTYSIRKHTKNWKIAYMGRFSLPVGFPYHRAGFCP